MVESPWKDFRGIFGLFKGFSFQRCIYYIFLDRSHRDESINMHFIHFLSIFKNIFAFKPTNPYKINIFVIRRIECQQSISQICTYHIFLESWRQDESIEGSNSFFQKKIFFSDPLKNPLKFSIEKCPSLDPPKFSNTPPKPP